MNCQSTHTLFSDYYDGGLLPAERQSLEEHLKGCTACTSEFKCYTESMEALHKTRPLETTQVFLANVRAAAAAHLDRRENLVSDDASTEALTVRAPKVAPPPPTGLFPGPPWVPWALAAACLVSFGLGWLAFGRRSAPDPATLEALVAQHLAEAQKVRSTEKELVKEPFDLQKWAEAQGLVDYNGHWYPKDLKDALEKGDVILGGKPLSKEEAFKELSKEVPPKAPPAPPPPAPPAQPSEEELLRTLHLIRVGKILVPEDWPQKWAEGYVQLAPDRWEKADYFRQKLIEEDGLVEVDRKLMSREQKEAHEAQQFIRRPQAASVANEVTALLDGLKIAPPRNFRGLTVYPLLRTGEKPRSTFMTLHAAQGPGTLEVVDDRFFSAQVKNPLDADVFFLTGEILTGGRSTRVVTEDTLVAHNSSGKVPVLCVEPASWRSADRFSKESGHYLAPPSVRRGLIGDQGQGALWAGLSRKLDKGHAGEVELFKKHEEALAEYRAYFSTLAEREPEAVGIAVALGDGLEFVEIFQDPPLLAAYLDRLIAGAALDVLERPPEQPSRWTAAAFPNTTQGVKLFLENAFFWTYEPRDDGYGIRKEESWLGRARLSAGVLTHGLFLVPGGGPEGDRRSAYTVPQDKISKALLELESKLKSMGSSRKIAALRDIAFLNGSESTKALLIHLNETDSAVRRAIIQDLGASQDPRATEALLQVMSRSRTDAALFSETVRALDRLGDPRAVDPMLRQLDAGDIELARVIVLGMPELLLQVRNRDLLERATSRLVGLYEAAEGMTRGDVILDPVAKNARPAEAQALAEFTRQALRQLVGQNQEFNSAVSARRWWNDRDTKEKFLKERTGK